MANTREYKIVINGISESINAIDSLNKKLENLEQRINTINSTKVSSSAGGTSRTSNTSALSEEEKLARQIEQIDAKREAYSKEIYQNYLAAKDVLSETVKDQKQLAASERLSAKNYSNTMAGMKQELADIKQVMQTVDLGDTAEFDRLTQRANELNEALKKIEATYGQFGRNVGNYGDAFKDLQKVTITVNGVEREFKNATVASRTLNKELDALKINGNGNTKQADELRKIIHKLNSEIKDATVSSQAMDEAMDWMESFTAMASVGKGLKAFFGIDDTEITKSIQQLVALQGVLNGVEKIRKQIDTGEGIGKIFGKWFENIDKYTNRLLAMNRAMLGTGSSAKIAAAGIKVLSSALKTIVSFGVYEVIELAQVAIGKLVGALKDWVKGDADLISSTDAVNAAIDSQNRILEERLKLVQANMNANNITPEQARIETEKSYAKALEETNKRLKERAEILALQGINRNGNAEKRTAINLGGAIGDKGVTTIGGFDEGIKSIDDFIKRWDEVEKAVSNDKGLNKLFSTASDARDELSHLAKLVGGDFVNAINKFSDGTEKGARQLTEYVNKMDKLTSGRYSKAIQLVKVDNEGLQKELDEAWKLVQNLRDNIFKNPIIVKIELDTKIEQELDRLDPTRAMQRQLDGWKDLLKKGVNEAGEQLSVEEVANINKIVSEQEKALKKARRDRAKSERNDAKAIAAEAENYRKQLRELQIQNMKDGWEKEKAQLKEEWRQRLFEVKNNGVKVKQLEAEINKLYNKKIEDAEREHNAEMAAIYKESWNEIYRISDTSLRMNLDSELTKIDTMTKKIKQIYSSSDNSLGGSFSKRYASYGGTRFNNNVKNSTLRGLGYDVLASDAPEKDKKSIKLAKEYLDILEEIALYRTTALKFDDSEDNNKEAWNKAIKKLYDFLEENKTTTEELNKLWATQDLIQNGYTKSLVNSYKIRIREASLYYARVGTLEVESSKKILNNELALLKNEENAEKRAEQDRFENQMAELNANLRDGLMTREHYDELVERAYEEHGNALKAIGDRADAEQERLQQEHQDRNKEIVAEGLRGMLNEYRDAYAAISKLQSRQPQLMKSTIGEFGIESGLGDFGVVSIKATRKNYKEALEAYQELSKNILKEKETLQERLDNKEITFDDFQQAKRELDGLAQDTADAAQDVTEKLKDVEGEFIRSIQQYIQAVGQGLQTIMSAVWSAQDTEFDNESRQLDKLNEKLQTAMDKNEEILEKHKDNVQSIEEELQTARGDRRQRLIDQLNEEMNAERRAAAEKKRLEKEQEALKKKQEKLDQKRQEAQYERELAQILVSGALAAINAYATKPFIPVGLAMGSLALGITAAQYAIAKAHPPKFANGGLLEGKSHAQGGIKAGGVELEGHEYVINKHTTMDNLDLLEYINSKKKRIDISDLVDFYGGTVKSTIKKMSPSRKYADGGVLPTLNNDYSIDDRLLNAFEDYSNRPVVVSVRDINARQAAVRDVQVLAGLDE